MADGAKIGSITWIDLTVEDAESTRDFYQNVVGWESEGVDMDGYQDFAMKPPGETSPVTGVCHARGGNADLPAQWMIYIRVADLETSLEAVRAGGGSCVTEIKNLGPTGRYCIIRDPAGAVSALFENRPEPS